MAKRKKENQRVKSGFLTRVLLLLLLLGISFQLYSLRGQVKNAQASKDLLAVRVETLQQKNDALAADIAAGGSQEKMEEIAREDLGLVAPNEYVFRDISN